MMGGATLAISNDVWEFGSSGWISQGSVTSMAGRAGHAMLYDAARGAVVAYGGLNAALDYETDTWAYSRAQIRTQPVSQTVNTGESATFTIVTTSPPQSVQWFMDGSAIAGANAQTLQVSNSHRINAGVYTAIVNFACGAQQTPPATLTVRSCCGPSFSGLGNGQYPEFPPPMTAVSLSGDGRVIVGYKPQLYSYNRYYAWRSTNAGSSLLDASVNYASSQAYAASDDGSVIVGFGDTASGFRWTIADGLWSIPVPPNWSSSVYPFGVSADGNTITGYGQSASGYGAFLWKSTGGSQSLGVLPGWTSSFGSAVSRDGSVVVGSLQNTSPYFSRAFRWTASSGMVELGTIPGDEQSSARDVNGDGSVIVGSSGTPGLAGGVQHAFRWTTATGMVGLGSLPGGNLGEAVAVSADGSVVVGNFDDSRPFLYRTGLGMVDLNAYLPTFGIDLTGWQLSKAIDVSADGQTILGKGSHNGLAEYWLASIAPAPCYANCDNSTASPVLTANDFQCFLNAFASSAAYANCDESTANPVLTANDFQCFLNKFAAGCP